MSSSGQHGQCHPTRRGGRSAGGPWPRGRETTLACPQIGQSVWCRPWATSDVGPSSAPLLLLPSALGPPILQICTPHPTQLTGRHWALQTLSGNVNKPTSSLRLPSCHWVLMEPGVGEGRGWRERTSPQSEGKDSGTECEIIQTSLLAGGETGAERGEGLGGSREQVVLRDLRHVLCCHYPRPGG